MYNTETKWKSSQKANAIGGFDVTSSPPYLGTKTKDLSSSSSVRPPAIVHFSIVICVSSDSLQTNYLRIFKTSRVTINHGLNEQVPTIFIYCILNKITPSLCSHEFIINPLRYTVYHFHKARFGSSENTQGTIFARCPSVAFKKNFKH